MFDDCLAILNCSDHLQKPPKMKAPVISSLSFGLNGNFSFFFVDNDEAFVKRQLCFPVHQTSWLSRAENGCVGGSIWKMSTIWATSRTDNARNEICLNSVSATYAEIHVVCVPSALDGGSCHSVTLQHRVSEGWNQAKGCRNCCLCQHVIHFPICISSCYS